MKNTSLNGISLFSSAGIGDLAIKKLGVEILVANELLIDRANILSQNFPETDVIIGDIHKYKDDIISKTKEKLQKDELDIVFATPPCQGMSKNGRGKLLSAIRAGKKPAMDSRNRLIMPTLEIVKELKPNLLLMENVPEMETTSIVDHNGDVIGIIDYIRKELGTQYKIDYQVVEFADYGVPQCRQRLILVATKINALAKIFDRPFSFLPNPTHSKDGCLVTRKWVSVLDAISHLPKLDAKNVESASSEIPYHRVPILDDDKYFWVSNTPPENGAFDNQCISCGYSNNPTHKSTKNKDGINKASDKTPLYCINCEEILPRPWVKESNGELRLMSGYTSAYRRMKGDLPSSALTRNLSYACSDKKLHPFQNRVLSLKEAMILHTLDKFEFDWVRSDGKKVSDKTIREAIGESIPPMGLYSIFLDIFNCIKEYNDIKSKKAA